MITINSHKVEPTIFPDGTSQVWHLPQDIFDADEHNVVWMFESEPELFHLVQLNWLLTRDYDKPCSLLVPYFPYARQHQSTDNENTFALGPFLRILSNTTSWDIITTYDAHFTFEIESSFLPFVSLKPPHLQALCDRYDTLIFPDKGASERYKWINHKNIVTGSKVRNQATGIITHYETTGNPTGMALVVDDLCDGGATFHILGESLERRVESLDLYVTHGIFSKGIDTLLNKYDRIYTTNTYIKNKIRHHRLYIEQIC
jgi:ribose-phosphate pyrophosphokinase